MIRRLALHAVLAAALFITSCASGSSSTSTEAGSATTTTTAAVGDDTTTTAGATPATEPAPSTTNVTDFDPNDLARRTVQAALDTLPADWSGSIASDLGEEGTSGDDIVFNPCLGPTDYNLDNLDLDSAASWELDAMGPESASPFGGAEASLEARVFVDEATAEAAYATLEKILGTDEGRECMASATPGQLADDSAEGEEYDARVEGTTIEGADVGARMIVSITTEGFTFEIFVDFAAYRDGAATIFATFISFGVPVDQLIASAMFLAAVGELSS